MFRENWTSLLLDSAIQRTPDFGRDMRRALRLLDEFVTYGAEERRLLLPELVLRFATGAQQLGRCDLGMLALGLQMRELGPLLDPPARSSMLDDALVLLFPAGRDALPELRGPGLGSRLARPTPLVASILRLARDAGRLEELGEDWSRHPLADRAPLLALRIHAAEELQNQEDVGKLMALWASLTEWRQALGEAEQLRIGEAWTTAERALERARAQSWHDGSLARVAFETGLLHRARGEEGEARAAFESAARLAPASFETRVAWLYLTGEAEGQDPGFASRLARSARERDERDPESWLALGAAHYRRQDLAQAFDALQHAVDRRIAEPPTARELCFLSLAETRMGAHKDAVRHFTQALHWSQQQPGPRDSSLASVFREVESVLGIEIR